MANQYRGKPRPHAANGEGADLLCYFLLDGCRNGRAIQNLWH
jgi:hypothetical protein